MTPPGIPKASPAAAAACDEKHPYTDYRERQGSASGSAADSAPIPADAPDNSWDTYNRYERSYPSQNESSGPADWANPDSSWYSSIDEEYPVLGYNTKGRGKGGIAKGKGKGAPRKGGRGDKSQGKGGVWSGRRY